MFLGQISSISMSSNVIYNLMNTNICILSHISLLSCISIISISLPHQACSCSVLYLNLARVLSFIPVPPSPPHLMNHELLYILSPNLSQIYSFAPLHLTLFFSSLTFLNIQYKSHEVETRKTCVNMEM